MDDMKIENHEDLRRWKNKEQIKLCKMIRNDCSKGKKKKISKTKRLVGWSEMKNKTQVGRSNKNSRNISDPSLEFPKQTSIAFLTRKTTAWSSSQFVRIFVYLLVRLPRRVDFLRRTIVTRVTYFSYVTKKCCPT